MAGTRSYSLARLGIYGRTKGAVSSACPFSFLPSFGGETLKLEKTALQ